MQKLYSSFFLLLIFFACSCSALFQTPLHRAVKDSDLIFKGKLVAISDTTLHYPGSTPTATISLDFNVLVFEIDTLFKGNQNGTVRVLNRNEEFSKIQAKKGDQVLLFCTEREPNLYRTDVRWQPHIENQQKFRQRLKKKLKRN